MSRRDNPIVRFAVDRQVTMGMIVLGVLVLGWISLTRLPLEFLPSFSSSNVSVRVAYPSSSPQEVERLVARPLEDALSTINGIETLSASASADSAVVNITFVDGTDMDMAAVDVRDRVDRARHLLPADLERIWIRRFQTGDIPVLRLDLSADWPQTRLFEFAETVLQRRLERLEGVAQVEINGLRTPQVQVNLDPARLEAHRVDLRALVARLRDANVNVSGGDVIVGSRKLLVRTVGEFSTLDEIRRLPIDGRGLRLADVADVAYAFSEQEQFSFLNGVEALTVEINKASTANLLAVVDRVKEELAAIAALPDAEGMSYRIYSDASLDVRQGLGQLRDAGLIGGLLAVLAVYFFLRRFRTTALVAVAIPISVVATLVLIYLLRQAGALDITLNVVSLAGLMLALGMLVDNSIVVIESIFRHRNELGEDSRTAALAGTSEVALPIVASTVTTICVFLPLIFLGGGSGRFRLYMQNIGVTVCLVMIASLLVALTVVPMAAAWGLRRQEARTSNFTDRMTGAYAAVLRFTLRHRLAFVLSIVALFAGVVWLFGTIERSFSTHPLERQVIVRVDTPRQYSPEQTAALYAEIYALIDAQREALDIADISHSYDRGTGRWRASWRRSRQLAVYLKDEKESDLTTAQVRDRIQMLLPVRAGVELKVATERGRYGGGGVEVQILGDDPAVLELLAETIAGRLRELAIVADVDTSLESGDEEIHVEVDRERALQAGLSTRAVAATVANALSSRAVSHFKTAEREVDLVMQYREADRETLEQLKNVSVFASETPLPLAALADFRRATGPETIERENHQAKVTVTATTRDPRPSFAAMHTISSMLDAMALPPGYSWSFSRWNQFMQREQESGLFALIFALPLVYMLMAALFESFSQPFTIMFSVPFALLGVGLVMKLAGQPWDTMTMLGLIILLGVVVNNAIVLIDHIDFLRQGGLSREEAIIRGGQHRMRPILITAITTILGMTPMVAPYLFPGIFGPVEGRASTWAPIGLVIIGGLTTSTFLTLIIIPTVYSLIDDLTRSGRRVWRAVAVACLAAVVIAGCGGDAPAAGDGTQGGARPGQGGGRQGAAGGAPTAAVPVEVQPAERRDISSYIQTNGTLEAENEVDVVARVSAPVIELATEEGRSVRKGQRLARLDPQEIRAQYEISRVTLEEARLAFERAKTLAAGNLISAEAFEQALTRHETAKAQFERDQIQLGYTEITAPFDGTIVARYVDLAQQVSPNTPLFRISDFRPLLCPIQVPERELPNLAVGQGAYLTVESWPGERFEAKVARIRPVVDAASGTVRVTLEVDGRDRLRPGMFARVFLETARRPDALVIPKAALSLESIGDTVYVADGGVARRRDVVLGFAESDRVEVRSGVEAGELVVVVGQDGLSDGTPIRILRGPGAAAPAGQPPGR